MSDKPVFEQFNLVVSDMAASIAFYRRLGMEIPDFEGPWAAHHRNAVTPDGLDLDFDSEASARIWDRGRDEAGRRMGVLGFRVRERETVDALYADLTGAGYAGEQEPTDAFFGSRFAVVQDPDGNAVAIMSPPDPARKFDPPNP